MNRIVIAMLFSLLAPSLPVVAEADEPQVRVSGKAVDDETGEPVSPLVVQGGMFDPKDPGNKVTWGFSESRSTARDGSFSATIQWTKGWTARVVADGYLPQPVLDGPPPPGKDTLEVVLRLKRGKLVRGQVLNHEGKPVEGAAVFAIGPTLLNLWGGKAWSYEGEDETAKPVHTDANGRFELPAGEAKGLAVSSETFDVWPAPIPADGDVEVALPSPASVEVEYDIQGAAPEGEIFYQLLIQGKPEFEGLPLQSMRELPLKSGEKLSLAALPPGNYQFCRQHTNQMPEIGVGAMLDRQFVELKAGETKKISFVREKGARLRGNVTLPEGVKLQGVVVEVRALAAEKNAIEGHDWVTVHHSGLAEADGGFVTERIEPGRYRLVAEGYEPLTPEARFRTGLISPSYHAEAVIEVADSGEAMVSDLKLLPGKSEDRR